MLAFVRALAIGATHLETDVHASSDGVAIVSHDPDLRRVVGRPDRVSDLTLAELEKIPLGQDQGFSSLKSVLDAFPDARINIDIKSADAVQPTVDAILAARATNRVLVTSFDGRRRRAAVERLPGVATSASSGTVALAALASRLAPHRVLAWTLRNVDAVQIPERYGPFRLVTRRALARWAGTGVEVHVWTVNDPADIRRLLAWGVHGIVTDRADLALTIVGDRA